MAEQINWDEVVSYKKDEIEEFDFGHDFDELLEILREEGAIRKIEK